LADEINVFNEATIMATAAAAAKKSVAPNTPIGKVMQRLNRTQVEPKSAGVDHVLTSPVKQAAAGPLVGTPIDKLKAKMHAAQAAVNPRTESTKSLDLQQNLKLQLKERKEQRKQTTAKPTNAKPSEATKATSVKRAALTSTVGAKSTSTKATASSARRASEQRAQKQQKADAETKLEEYKRKKIASKAAKDAETTKQPTKADQQQAVRASRKAAPKRAYVGNAARFAASHGVHSLKQPVCPTTVERASLKERNFVNALSARMEEALLMAKVGSISGSRAIFESMVSDEEYPAAKSRAVYWAGYGKMEEEAENYLAAESVYEQGLSALEAHAMEKAVLQSCVAEYRARVGDRGQAEEVAVQQESGEIDAMLDTSLEGGEGGKAAMLEATTGVDTSVDTSVEEDACKRLSFSRIDEGIQSAISGIQSAISGIQSASAQKPARAKSALTSPSAFIGSPAAFRGSPSANGSKRKARRSSFGESRRLSSPALRVVQAVEGEEGGSADSATESAAVVEEDPLSQYLFGDDGDDDGIASEGDEAMAGTSAVDATAKADPIAHSSAHPFFAEAAPSPMQAAVGVLPAATSPKQGAKAAAGATGSIGSVGKSPMRRRLSSTPLLSGKSPMRVAVDEDGATKEGAVPETVEADPLADMLAAAKKAASRFNIGSPTPSPMVARKAMTRCPQPRIGSLMGNLRGGSVRTAPADCTASDQEGADVVCVGTKTADTVSAEAAEALREAGQVPASVIMLAEVRASSAQAGALGASTVMSPVRRSTRKRRRSSVDGAFPGLAEMQAEIKAEGGEAVSSTVQGEGGSSSSSSGEAKSSVKSPAALQQPMTKRLCSTTDYAYVPNAALENSCLPSSIRPQSKQRTPAAKDKAAIKSGAARMTANKLEACLQQQGVQQGVQVKEEPKEETEQVEEQYSKQHASPLTTKTMGSKRRLSNTPPQLREAMEQLLMEGAPMESAPMEGAGESAGGGAGASVEAAGEATPTRSTQKKERASTRKSGRKSSKKASAADAAVLTPRRSSRLISQSATKEAKPNTPPAV
jgi:hypothetical protein